MASRPCASMCTRGKTAASRWPGTDSPWTHQCIIACEKGIYPRKGELGEGGRESDIEAAEEPHERVHRGFRHPISKQRDVNLQRKKKETRHERERKSFSIAPVRAWRCLIRLTAKQPRRGLIKKGTGLI